LISYHVGMLSTYFQSLNETAAFEAATDFHKKQKETLKACWLFVTFVLAVFLSFLQ